MQKSRCLLLVSAIFGSLILNAQVPEPRIAPQSGFSFAEIQCRFELSPRSQYLLGSNAAGEYLLWDVASGRQLKRFNALIAELPELLYESTADFSPDEQLLLVPDFPHGNYWLYNIKADSIQYMFAPPNEGDHFTYAQFSADGQRLLLVLQRAGSKVSQFYLYSLSGELIKSIKVTMPDLLEEYGFAGKLAMLPFKRTLGKVPQLPVVVASPTLEEVYFTNLLQRVFSLSLKGYASGSALDQTDLGRADIPGSPAIERLTVNDNHLVAHRAVHYEDQPDKKNLGIDTLFVFDRFAMRLREKVVSRLMIPGVDNRSNGTSSLPVFSNKAGNVYFDTQKNGSNGKDEVVCYDLLTKQKLFSYPTGDIYYWYNQRDYEGGVINGGYIVALSADKRLMVENTRDMLIHDIPVRRIKSQFSVTRGQIKLNQPVFLDTYRVFIPKVYNDGFVVDYRTGKVDRLKQRIDCQDTVRNGANLYFAVDISAQIGLQNAQVSLAEKKLVIAHYIPNDLCTTGNNKVIEVWDTEKMIKTGEYAFQDWEYTNHLNPVPGHPQKFLVNYKLVDFAQASHPSVKELKFIHRKDTFMALNPVYLRATNSIFAIMGTRIKPGNPDLIFAHYSPDGTLLKSYRFERKKSKSDYQTWTYEAQLSPDSSRLLFCLEDGTMGVFDIKSMKMLQRYTYSEWMTVRWTDLKLHFYALAACFMDNDHFVTAGSDGKLLLWSLDKTQPARSIRAEQQHYFYGLTLSPDKRYLLGTDMDKSVHFINCATGKTDLLFSAFNFENYALVNRDGYYMTNKKGAVDLSFVYQGKGYGFSQFDIGLNRPDKVLEQLGYVSPAILAFYRKAYEKRLQKLGYKTAFGIDHKISAAPEMSLAEVPDQVNATSAGEVSFLVKASDGVYPIDRLHVTVNGVPLYGIKGQKIGQGKPGSVSIPVKVPLSAGKNRIVVSVMNQQAVESVPEYLTITRKGAVVKPDLYLVTIGAGSFVQKGKNLPYAAKDAGDVQQLFIGRSAAFGKVIKTQLVAEKVTRSAILAIKEQLKRSRPDDVVILFYAGHGMVDEELNYYLSTYAVNFNKPARDGIGYEELESLLDSIPARNKLLLLDACNSGEIDKESINEMPLQDATGAVAGKVNTFELMRLLFPDLRRSSGASVIAAASASQYAAEGNPWKNGVFTYSLLLGLKDKKADLDKDGMIYLSELLAYLQNVVPDLTRGRQQPTSRSENLVNNFRIW